MKNLFILTIVLLSFSLISCQPKEKPSELSLAEQVVESANNYMAEPNSIELTDDLIEYFIEAAPTFIEFSKNHPANEQTNPAQTLTDLNNLLRRYNFTTPEFNATFTKIMFTLASIRGQEQNQPVAPTPFISLSEEDFALIKQYRNDLEQIERNAAGILN